MAERIVMPARDRAGVGAKPLQAESLGIRFSSRELGPFTFDVEPGELVCLLGGNGSGKTTAIRLALGLVRATTGAAQVFGESVSPTRPPNGVGYVPDKADFLNWQSAENNLTPFAADPGQVSAILDRVGLGHAASQQVRRFSRGMRQRLSIARALVAQSSLLVMDEPTIALDVEGIDLLVNLICERGESGGATLIATHDQGFLERVDGRIVRVEDGHTT